MSTETYSEVGEPRPWITKDPGANLDYSIDLASEGWLADGESVASYTIAVDGVTLEDDSIAGAVITAWVSGGTANPGEVASITFAWVTDSIPARRDQRTIYLKIRER